MKKILTIIFLDLLNTEQLTKLNKQLLTGYPNNNLVGIF